MDHKWANSHMKRIGKISDEYERKEQQDLLGNILTNMALLEFMEDQSYRKDIWNDFLNRGIEINKADLSCNQLHDKWVDTFAKDIPIDVRKEIHIEQYMWHVFSFEKIKASCKKNARNRFNHISKDKIYLFYQNQDEAFCLKNASSIKSSDLKYEQDVYITDTNFTWTYVFTHERQCGPYFYSMNKK